MSSIIQFIKNFLGSSSSESDVDKYVELLNDTQVNQLKFPGNSRTYKFNINDLRNQTVICINNNASVEHYVFHPLKFPLVAKTLRIPITQSKVNEEGLKELIKEVEVLCKISHDPNVIDFYGYAIDEEKVWIFMELMEASLEDLYKYFHEKLYPELRLPNEIVIPENVVGIIAVRILDALAFCKEQGVMHRDVKPTNVLVNKKGEVKLCDFGDSKILESGSITSTFKGTLVYLPPERCENEEPYDDRTDIWSLGITLVEIAYGHIPYDIKKFDQQRHFVQIMDIIKKTNGNEIMSRCFGEEYSEDLRYFVRSCLEELDSRPKYQKLMEMNLYKSFVAKDDNKKTMELFMEIYSESLNLENNSLNAKADYNRGLAQQELKPDYAAYNNRGIAHYELGKYNEAIADYTKAIELNPTYIYAYYNRGDAHNSLGKYIEAIADYTKTIELDPTDAIAYSNRGGAQNGLGKYIEAIEDCTKANELDPTYADTYYNKGLAQDGLRKYNEAIVDYTKAIELDPTHVKAYNNRGNAQSNLEKYNEAIADCTKAIELDPTGACAYDSRGYIHEKLGQYKKAIEDFSLSIKLDPTDPSSYYGRGNAQLEQGQFSDAIKDYTEFVRLNPYDRREVSNSQLDQRNNKMTPTFTFYIEWNSLYALAYNNNGISIEEARKCNIDFPQDFEWNPSNVFAYNNRGIAHIKLVAYDKAVADFTEAIELKPSCALFYNNRGTVQAELGKYDEAIADYKKAIELNPELNLAVKNQQVLMDKINSENRT